MSLVLSPQMRIFILSIIYKYSFFNLCKFNMRSLLFFVFQFMCFNAWSLYCHEIFKESSQFKISLGEQVDVRLETLSLLGKDVHWRAGESKSLIYIGRARNNEDMGKDFLIFSDAKLNTYYFEISEISINNQPARLFNTQQSLLAPIIKQTEGSCNLCANITALNQLAIDRHLEPVKLSGRKLEKNTELDSFSYEANVRNFLWTLYNRIWPEGYKEGMTSQVSIRDILTMAQKAQKDFKLNQKTANTRTLGEKEDHSTGASSISLPLEVQGQSTRKETDFIAHIRGSGTAVVGGMIVPGESQSLINKGTGYFDISAPKATLSPLSHRVIKLIRTLGGFYWRIRLNMSIMEQLFEGVEPNPQMIKDMMRLMASEVGHAVAVIKIIESGPLKDHVVIGNSVPPVYEIHPLSNFPRGLSYRLISPRAD